MKTEDITITGSDDKLDDMKPLHGIACNNCGKEELDYRVLEEIIGGYLGFIYIYACRACGHSWRENDHESDS